MTEMMMPLTGNETTARFAHKTAQYLNRGADQARYSFARLAQRDNETSAPIGAGTVAASVIGIGAALFLAAAALALV